MTPFAVASSTLRLAPVKLLTAPTQNTLWNGKSIVAAGITPPRSLPAGTTLVDWANQLDLMLHAEGYSVQYPTDSSYAVDASLALKEISGKRVIVQLPVETMTEKAIRTAVERSFQLDGFHLIHGLDVASNPLSLTVDDALIMVKESQPNALRVCNLALPSRALSFAKAVEGVGALVNKGCNTGIVSPWANPQLAESFIRVCNQQFNPLFPVFQAVCPLSTKNQWERLQARGILISRSIESELTDASREAFAEVSMEQSVQQAATSQKVWADLSGSCDLEISLKRLSIQ